MSPTLVFVLCLVLRVDCHQSDENPPKRIRIRYGEIVPTSVTLSGESETETIDGSDAVDLDFTTSVTALSHYGSYAWIRLNFAKLHCITHVIRFYKDSSIRHYFVCGNESCRCDTGPNCEKWDIFVMSNPEDKSTLMDIPDCKKGNWVKLQAKWRESSPTFYELAVFGTADNVTFSNIVDDGTSLEGVYWSLVGLFSMSSTTLGILLALKYNSDLPILLVRLLKRCFTPVVEQLLQCIYKCFSSNNAEDEHECDDLEPVPNSDDDNLELANDNDFAIDLANNDDAAPEPTNEDEHVLELEVEPASNGDDALEPTDNTVSALKPEPIYTIPHCHLIQKVKDISSSSSSSQSDDP